MWKKNLIIVGKVVNYEDIKKINVFDYGMIDVVNGKIVDVEENKINLEKIKKEY